MRTHWLAFLLALIAACGGKPDHCADPHGTYLVTYEQLSGDCGNPKAQVVNVDTPDTNCSGPTTTSSGGCNQTADQTCYDPESGYTSKVVGGVEIDDKNADSVHGTITLTVSGNGKMCQGTYRVTWSRP